jgi:hypothetical protein
MIKFASDAADGSFVTDVGCAKAAGGHAANVISEFRNDDGFAHARGLNCGSYAGNGRAIDANVGFDNLRSVKTVKL